MIKKALGVAVMLLAAMSVRAQIGYKGQVALGISGGISNVGGFVGTAHRRLSLGTFDLGGRDDPRPNPV